ncbi:MAG: hypothetical protein PHF84_10085 [bacterium]|nr:hypothetical protein [bacterium]
MRTFCILFFFCLSGQYLFSAFDVPQIGAKSVALSEGYCAVADNVTAVYCNPGGLGQLRNNQLFLSFVSLYQGLDDYIYNGSINFSVYNINVGTLAAAWYGLFTELYQENIIALSYGRDLFRTLLKYSQSELYAGFSAKILQKGYRENGYTRMDPVFEEGLSRLGVAMDAGMLFRINRKWQTGLSFQNINRPDLGLKEKSRVPLVITGALACDLAPWLKPGDGVSSSHWLDRLRLSLGARIREKEYRLSPGVEFSFLHIFDLCASYSMGEKQFQKFSAGLGFVRSYRYPSEIEKKRGGETYEVVEVEKRLVFNVNYSFAYYLNLAHQFTYGNHYIELGVQF